MSALRYFFIIGCGAGVGVNFALMFTPMFPNPLWIVVNLMSMTSALACQALWLFWPPRPLTDTAR